jgi:hypothetical protein
MNRPSTRPMQVFLWIALALEVLATAPLGAALIWGDGRDVRSASIVLLTFTLTSAWIRVLDWNQRRNVPTQ